VTLPIKGKLDGGKKECSSPVEIFLTCATDIVELAQTRTDNAARHLPIAVLLAKREEPCYARRRFRRADGRSYDLDFRSTNSQSPERRRCSDGEGGA